MIAQNRIPFHLNVESVICVHSVHFLPGNTIFDIFFPIFYSRLHAPQIICVDELLIMKKHERGKKFNLWIADNKG